MMVEIATTVATWFGEPSRPLLGWITRPAVGVGRSGVVIAPPLGYEYLSTHRALRTLAERLARAGHTVLRFDYDGTGDSAGDQWDGGRVAAWRASIRTAVAQVREAGADQVVLVGVRLGATMCLLDGAAIRADRIVAWMPVVSGRRYGRELRLLATQVPEELEPLHPPGSMTFAGNVFSAQTVDDLRELDLTAISDPPAEAVLVVDAPAGTAETVVTALRGLGVDATHAPLEGTQESVFTAPEFAVVPDAIIDAISGWIGPAPPLAAAVAGPRDDTGRPVAMTWRAGSVTETVLRLGALGHVAILTEPRCGHVAPTTLVLLNPGSETHVGPGRAWVELARQLALAGRRTIRVDFRGWGESPDDGRAPGRPYDEVCEQDTVAIVSALRDAGVDHVAVCGLCAAAWIVLRVASEVSAAGVIALNPQLYWKRGDPVEIDWDLIRRRRADEIRGIERGARVGLWTLLDRLGHRSAPARWLDQLACADVPVHLLFAEDDDGLIYLHGRHARRLERVCRRGPVTVRELQGVDHPMHRVWTRDRVVQALAESLAAIDGGD